ncbi:MAG: signal peptidase II [Phoenicibacter congonensis]|uniref:Lipoprotein signal peptidase n=1 Tax=Phoenicibacter congonensis TaxID=1944646 RepID=A0AA43RKM6_9ACTN|nr:signal peptidase II [Phoenicibacter congonensis]
MEAKNNRIVTLVIFIAIVAIVMIIDQWTKSLANVHEVGDVYATLIPGVLQLTLVHNTGAAWGMFGDWTNGFIVVALIVCILLFCFVFLNSNNINKLMVVSCALLFAGGLGNAVDRFMNGYVVDMIEAIFIDYPVFNVADCAITIGVALLIINILFLNKRHA